MQRADITFMNAGGLRDFQQAIDAWLYSDCQLSPTQL